MKMAIEVFTMIVTITVASLIFASMISITVQNSQARDYFNIVRNRVEDSDYRSEVMSQCVQEAKEKGYELEIKDVTIHEGETSKLIALRYEIMIPVYQFIGSERSKEVVIEGYAR